MSLIIVLRNTTDLKPVSNYEYKVLIGDGGPNSKVLETGKVLKHHRKDGWEALIEKFLYGRFKDEVPI